jgi:hypothetical protein
MSTQFIVESADTPQTAHRSLAVQIERLDRLIAEAETRLEDQEAYVREVSLVSGSTAIASFELQKLQLLVALLREGRARLSDNSCVVRMPAAPSASARRRIVIPAQAGLHATIGPGSEACVELRLRGDDVGCRDEVVRPGAPSASG